MVNCRASGKAKTERFPASAHTSSGISPSGASGLALEAAMKYRQELAASGQARLRRPARRTSFLASHCRAAKRRKQITVEAPQEAAKKGLLGDRKGDY